MGTTAPTAFVARRWAIAGGGTGGHITPALALGEVMREDGDAVLFIGTRRGLETRLVPDAGFELVALDSKPLLGRGLGGRLRALVSLVGATRAARRALRGFGAEGVLSVGGYAAVPAMLAAMLARLPVVVVEPNARPGVAHRALARFARRVCVAFPAAAAALGLRPGDPRLRETGVPLRRALVAAFAGGSARRVPTPPFRLFVFGGSQGARQINDWMIEILPQLDATQIGVVHQTGADDRERVARAYADAGIAAEVVAFERDMPARYAWADLVVARAGALTVAEIALAGRPAVLIPLVHAGGGEQLPNAQSLEAAGAALVLDPRRDGPKALVETLATLLADPARLVAMGERAAARARPDAARRVVAACHELAAVPRAHATQEEGS